MLNEALYHDYLSNKLRPALKSDLSLLNIHGEPNLLTLKDEDIFQIVVEIIYSNLTLGDKVVQKLGFNRLELSDN